MPGKKARVSSKRRAQVLQNAFQLGMLKCSQRGRRRRPSESNGLPPRRSAPPFAPPFAQILAPPFAQLPAPAFVPLAAPLSAPLPASSGSFISIANSFRKIATQKTGGDTIIATNYLCKP